MVNVAFVLFIVAILAALCGLGDVAGLTAEVGYTLVVVSLVFLAIATVSGCAGVGFH
ncbi:MAG TPA: DUF1328 domain-containing protein [Candidatus Binatia bacterium]|nr:DUF1328 domain-containing protein [Candidatus Binatia bacterium]